MFFPSHCNPMTNDTKTHLKKGTKCPTFDDRKELLGIRGEPHLLQGRSGLCGSGGTETGAAGSGRSAAGSGCAARAGRGEGDASGRGCVGGGGLRCCFLQLECVGRSRQFEPADWSYMAY